MTDLGSPWYRTIYASQGDNEHIVVIQCNYLGEPFDFTGADTVQMTLRNDDLDVLHTVNLTPLDQVTNPGQVSLTLLAVHLALPGNFLYQIEYTKGTQVLHFPNKGGYGTLAVQALP